jgi:hypothetical protein
MKEIFTVQSIIVPEVMNSELSIVLLLEKVNSKVSIVTVKWC